MTKPTASLVAITVAFALAAFLLPAMPQSLGYHDFADHRQALGIANFFDVASNVAFLLAGVTGFVILARRSTVFEHDSERWPYAVFFVGLLLTSLGSAYYHLAPDNGRLFWDRLPMTIAFMGLVASQIVERINVRAGLVLLVPMLVLGAASVIYWDMTERAGHGNVLPYAMLQGYVIVVLLLIAILYPSRYTRARGLYYVFAWYVLSKVLEALDAEIFAAGHVVSGHTLKHLAAAGSGFTVCWMLAGRTVAPSRPERPQARVFHGLYRVLVNLARAVFLGWTTLAIYYSNLPWAWARIALAFAFLAFAAGVFWVARRRRAYWALAGVFAAFFTWWSLIPASHDRPWRPEVAVMPRAIVDGDRVRFTGVRNFEFRSRRDFTPRYEEREVALSHLIGVDFYVSYWAEGLVGHTFLSFTFDNAPPLSISIETRPEVGEGFDPLSSMFKQFELIYVVGDERDLVRLRTNHRDEEVFLYHTIISPAFARRLFMVYVERINALADRPEFYHLLSNSCTVNIVRYANAAGRAGSFDFRHLLNGLIDRYLYAAGVVDTSLPFEELRQRSRITRTAQGAADGPDFPARIRHGLPVPTGASPAAPSISTALAAHRWELLSAKDAGNAPLAALQPRPGTPIELEFVDGRLLVRGGCNPPRGAYRFGCQRQSRGGSRRRHANGVRPCADAHRYGACRFPGIAAPYRRRRRRCAADAAAVGDIIDPGVRRPTDARNSPRSRYDSVPGGRAVTGCVLASATCDSSVSSGARRHVRRAWPARRSAWRVAVPLRAHRRFRARRGHALCAAGEALCPHARARRGAGDVLPRRSGGRVRHAAEVTAGCGLAPIGTSRTPLERYSRAQADRPQGIEAGIERRIDDNLQVRRDGEVRRHVKAIEDFSCGLAVRKRAGRTRPADARSE